MWRRRVRRALSALVEHCARHELSFVVVPLLHALWRVPIEHFETPTTVRDLFVRYPDDIDVFRPRETCEEYVCAPCDGTRRPLGPRDARVKRDVRVGDCIDTSAAGPGVCIALFPNDFHHVFAPFDARCSRVECKGGVRRLDPTVDWCENVRTCVELESARHGVWELVLVGALGVASVRLFVGVGDRLARGQHLGHFDVGGSAVVFRRRRAGTRPTRLVDNGRVYARSSLEAVV